MCNNIHDLKMLWGLQIQMDVYAFKNLKLTPILDRG